MSELLDICREVSAIASEIGSQVGSLGHEARRIRTAASRTAQATRGSQQSARSVVAALTEAAQRCDQAAAILIAAEHSAEQFVSIQSGTASVASPAVPTNGDAGHARSSPSNHIDHAARFSSPVKGGIAFYDPQDKTLEAAGRLGSFSGMRKYDLHGTPSGVLVGGGMELSASEFADVIRADDGWSGLPVMLFSCETGKLPPTGGVTFAQQLADDLSVPVTAPTELAWSNGAPFSASGRVDGNGELWPTSPSDGEFRTFYPSSENQ